MPSARWYVDQNNPFKFGLLDLRNPNNIEQTSPFQITIFDGTGDDRIGVINNKRYAATPGSLENVKIFPENYKTSNPVPYEFSFETKNPLDAGSDIQIIVPIDIALDRDAIRVSILTTE